MKKSYFAFNQYILLATCTRKQITPVDKWCVIRKTAVVIFSLQLEQEESVKEGWREMFAFMCVWERERECAYVLFQWEREREREKVRVRMQMCVWAGLPVFKAIVSSRSLFWVWALSSFRWVPTMLIISYAMMHFKHCVWRRQVRVRVCVWVRVGGWTCIWNRRKTTHTHTRILIILLLP